ncbi:MAG TPA: hypothetical protein VN043_15050 [Rhodanobacter sp.]|nr:hypothetical protein [Rhodanobacter sp.]
MNDWHGLLGLMLGVIGLFAVVIVAGLRYSRRTQARNLHEITAAEARAGIDVGEVEAGELLYGVWQTSLREVALVARDGHDEPVGTISRRDLLTSITTSQQHFPVVGRPGRFERADLMAANGPPDGAPLCAFEVRGWGGRRVACYTLAAGDVLVIRARWSWPWRQAPLQVWHGGRIIGRLSAIGGPAFNHGRVLLLPTTIPMPVRLFMLWKGTGTRTGVRGS